MVLLAPLIGLSTAQVARDPRHRAHDAAGRPWRRYVPGGDASVMQQRPFIGNLLTSDPLARAQCRRARGRTAVGDRLADGDGRMRRSG
jgi:hypothetical protein